MVSPEKDKVKSPITYLMFIVIPCCDVRHVAWDNGWSSVLYSAWIRLYLNFINEYVSL